ncbi:hypothetical protein EDC04DRAFT_2614205 [Pisolithus marmoratus]|nr:hypothetical protein EDC04DRAFT_2614205 [Pisolithus marmoratus]
MPCSCNECSLEFDNKVLHDMHWKKCIKTVTFVTHTGEQITITHHQNGTFVCYCSHPKCPKEKGFVTVDALQKHMKTLKTTWLGPEKKASVFLTWIQSNREAEGEAESSGNTQMSAGTIHTPKEEVAMASPNSSSPRSPMAMQVPSLMANQAESSSAAAGIQPHFIHHPNLDSLNLVVNAELSFLTCQLCKEGVAPTAGQAHLVAASLPNLTGPRSIVHGLMVFNTITCKFCTVIYAKQKNMREHHMMKHPGMPIPQHWQSCKAQHMKPEGAGTVCQLWGVTTQARAGEDSRERALADKLLGELEEQLKMVPWLLTTCWHEWAWWLRKPTEELHAMVALPRPSLPEEEHYKTLVESIKLYFEEAVMMIDSTDKLVLQWLNSPDPVKGHQHDGMLEKYMHLLICFITMLLMDQSHIVHQIHLMLLAVWTTPWSKSKYHIIPNPTESCLALLTLNQDGSFKSTKEVTTLITKFKYCMCLTFLREIRACASTGDIKVDEEAACNALQPWFTEKNYLTFARLCSLQHRASAISFSTMALPSIWWTDTEAWSTLSFKGNHVTFTDVCEIFKDMEEALVATWENKVLKGLELRADYEQVVDNPSNKDMGYSFLFDPSNACFQDRAHLVRVVVQGHGPFANFLVQREDELVWNRAALCGWLQDYAELQKLLLMCAEMLTRDTQNLRVFGKHITLLGQYSKMSALTCQDKLISHALDALTSNILIQDLALACPFAEITVRICFADEEVSQLYHDHLFVHFDRLFTSNDLSMVMAKYSLPNNLLPAPEPLGPG